MIEVVRCQLSLTVDIFILISLSIRVGEGRLGCRRLGPERSGSKIRTTRSS